MIRRNLAAIALAAGTAAGAAGIALPAAAQVTAPAHRCTVTVSNSVRLSPTPGYYQVTINRACSGVGVQPEVKCQDRSGTTAKVFGRVIFSAGVRSRATCPSARPHLDNAWVIIGGHSQPVFP